LEVYGGFANISIEGIKQGLKVAQPIDKVHGVAIETKADHEHLRQLLRRHRPFLTVWEIRCDPWSHIQHLNYTAEQLEELRAQHRLDLEEMAKTICELYELGCHFLLENPWGTEFWKQLELQPQHFLLTKLLVDGHQFNPLWRPNVVSKGMLNSPSCLNSVDLNLPQVRQLLSQPQIKLQHKHQPKQVLC